MNGLFEFLIGDIVCRTDDPRKTGDVVDRKFDQSKGYNRYRVKWSNEAPRTWMRGPAITLVKRTLTPPSK